MSKIITEHSAMNTEHSCNRTFLGGRSMDSEQIMLNLYKQQQYDQTRSKLQRSFMIITGVATIVGILITSLFYVNWVFVYMFSGMLFSILLNSFLVYRKKIKLQIASFFVMLYAGFIFIPVLWLTADITDGVPYVSLVILVSIMILFNGKLLKWLLGGFLLVVLGLTVHSCIANIAVMEDITSLVYIVSSFVIAVVLIVMYMFSKQREFNELNDKFLRSSFKDELTRLYNRKLLDLIIQYEEALYQKEHTDYILVMFDADDFKALNDTHGHVYGDIVLRSIAQCISENARSSDFVIRYGGDEFLVVQANASQASINAFIQRIDKAMETSCKLSIKISVSYGFASRSECDTPDAVLKLADERLYEKKEARKADRGQIQGK